jgi:hypothetical protein
LGKATVTWASSPEPTQLRTVPWPKTACFTFWPILKVSPSGLGAAVDWVARAATREAVCAYSQGLT